MSQDFVAHYRIKRKLGAGGMGEVYLAEDTKLHRLVALKFLPEELAQNGMLRERFVAEAEAAAALNHPNVCVIHEIGETEDARPFIAMEYLEGDTLDAQLRGVPLDLSVQLDIAIQVTAALTAAHAKGVIHRDVKPGNIILAPDGLVKVLDFGLAKRISFADECGEAEIATQFKTQEGAVLGTPHYMSPEQALGRQVDARTDIFSLGIVLYELVTGQLPFAGDTAAETLNNVINAQQVSVSSLSHTVPGPFERLIDRCLEKDPDARYQSTTELLADLRSLKRDSESIHATIVSSSDDTAVEPESKRLRLAGSRLAVSALLGAILFAIGLGVYHAFFRSSPNEPSGPPAAAAPDFASSSIRSLAVMPPRMIGAVSEDGFEEVVHLLLTNELGRIKALQITSPYSASLYKGSDKPVAVISEELDVDAIVESHIYRSGNLITISAALVSGDTEKQIWNDEFEGLISELESLKRSFAVAIAGEIKSALGGNSTESRSIDTEAFQYYLSGSKARSLYTRSGLETAVGEFQQAVDIDPEYAAAWAGLAESYRLLSTYYWLPAKAMVGATKAADQALELDPRSVEAQTTRALIRLTYEWEWETAREETDRALELNPSYADAYLADGWWLIANGQHRSSVDTLKNAQRFDPFSLSLSAMLELAYMMAPDSQAAIEQCRRSLALDESFSLARGDLALSLSLAGREDEAQEQIEIWEQQQVEQPDDSMMPRSLIANAYAVMGDTDRARRMLEYLEQNDTDRTYVCKYELGTAYLALGDKTKAIHWLEQGEIERSDCMVWINVDPRLGTLREDPQFKDRFNQLRRLVGFD